MKSVSQSVDTRPHDPGAMSPEAHTCTKPTANLCNTGYTCLVYGAAIVQPRHQRNSQMSYVYSLKIVMSICDISGHKQSLSKMAS